MINNNQSESSDNEQKKFLSNYIKYCLGYLRICNASLRPKEYISLNEKYLKIDDVLAFNADNNKVNIKLEVLNKYTPKTVTEENQKDYEFEKDIALNIENLISAQKNQEFTKDIIVRFGEFSFNIDHQLSQKAKLRGGKRIEKDGTFLNQEAHSSFLFYIKVSIKKIRGGYSLKITDDKIYYDLSMFENILENEDFYYDLLKDFGKFDQDTKLNLPGNIKILKELGEILVNKLRLTKINFAQNNCDFSIISLSLAPKSNYFLTKDLEILSEKKNEELAKSSIGVWSQESDNELNLVDNESIKQGNIFYPFKYNRSQLKVIQFLQNKAFIIEGPPGTGKSQTISNLLCHLVAKGKRILFVSQKQQALRVVKDKMNDLGIDHLFGYMTSDITEKQIYDSFSNSLERLKLDSFLSRHNIDEQDIQKQIKEIVEKSLLFNKGIKQQETIFHLKEKIKKYPEEYFYLENYRKLEEKLNLETVKNLQEKINKISYLEKRRKDYENTYKKEFDKFSEFFSTVLAMYWEKNLSADVEEMIDEMIQFDYDNQNLIKSIIKKIQLQKAHRNNIEKMPKEMTSILKKCLADKTKSLGTKVKFFESVQRYCVFQEQRLQIENTREQINEFLESINTTLDELKRIIKIILSSQNQKKELSDFFEFNKITEQIIEIDFIDYSNISNEINDFEKNRQKIVGQYLRNQIKYKVSLYKDLKATIRGKIISFAKGLKKSKKAFKTFERLRNDLSIFSAVSNIVPIWIMNLEDASRVLPLEQNLFDYVILDESSQCNIAYALPTMYRAEKAIIVGDPKQMRDDTVLFKKKSILEDLALRFDIDEDYRIMGRYENIKSILDIGILRGIKSKFLEEHYRSPVEIIGFCNENFYDNSLKVVNNSYLTYKDTNRVLVNHLVKYDTEDKENISPSVNSNEANEIIKFIKDIKKDPIYKDKSIAILSFFNDQADLIRKKIENTFGIDHNIKIGIIDGIQGEERDIVIFSLVIHDPSQKMQYVALTGEGGDIRPEIVRGRINVAFSRARLQVHCFTSLDYREWPEKIWLDKFLCYIETNGVVESTKKELRSFDSNFEKEFYDLANNKLQSKKYLIYNQVPTCGYYIDFVIQNKENNTKLAIECDGPCHFSDEENMEYIDSDIKRQMVLESAGWKFLRIKYSNWINNNYNRDQIIEEIKKELN